MRRETLPNTSQQRMRYVAERGETAMKRALCATLAALAVMIGSAAAQTAPTSNPALFVARDANSTLYLYGTIHLRRAGEPWGSPAVETALAASEEVWTELEISPAVEARAAQLALQHGAAPAGRTLSSWLTPEEAKRLRETAQRLGLQPQALEPLRPWLAGLTLTVLPMLRAGYDPKAGVDNAIDAYGDSHGKRMRAFETPEEQIGFLANLPDAVQRQMLLEAIDEADAGVAEFDQLSAAWQRGDLAAVERDLNEELRREYPEAYAALIERRNNAWVAVLLRELEGAGVDFVAVGAAHLVGEHGLVAQLRARGVRVDRVGAAP
jgi:uncharacterized protein YbaP (TraB family)